METVRASSVERGDRMSSLNITDNVSSRLSDARLG